MNNLVSNVNVKKNIEILKSFCHAPTNAFKVSKSDCNVFGGGKLIKKNLRPSFLIVETLFWFLEANKLKK